MTTLAIQMTGIDKRFAAVQANRGASLEVAKGEIHALMGENGAGKSTLVKILAGLQPPDAGQFFVDGREVTGWTTPQALTAGVAMVHQHFMLVPTLTVAENVVLGREPTHGLRLDRQAAVQAVRDLCQSSGLQVDPNRLVADLSVGEAQRVEILKVLYRGAQVLLLDEPTAVLSPPEVAELWGVLRRLQQGGATIVLISHKLDEVMAISQRVTVMRQGQTVQVLDTAQTTAAELARAMVGRDVDLDVQRPENQAGKPLLRVTQLQVQGSRGQPALLGLDLTIHAGEILGIAGVEGNGQSELLDALAGLRPYQGSIKLADQELATLSLSQRTQAGLAHVPEDRHQRALILDYSVADNLILGKLAEFSRRGVLDQRAIAAHAAELIAEYDIRPTDPQVPVRGLSGGNQQKVVLARELSRSFKVLLAAQPTRGVDVGAIEFIHARLRQARAQGKGVLLVSSELREILTLSDRIAVLYRGRIVAMLPRAQASESVLGAYMTGAAQAVTHG